MFVCLLRICPEPHNEIIVECVVRGCACHDIVDEEARKLRVPNGPLICKIQCMVFA